eukprot:TRINITY_DN45741_c0_g1_i1.p1 TRINITY_DN45741_c0_g1~~TRINITY_DN45741_c0_g1_i1.p1  ORF type:complete len:946 (-),score=237.93 TRINITY_DN45741_c0_g1_i1:335-3172(-)
MPLRLDVKKKLSARSDRVKVVDFHPTEPWVLSALYSGNVFIWDFNTQTLLKQLEVCNLPVRCAKFIPRKQWIITASDDMQVRVFNYNTLEKVKEIEAHTDYIRCLAVHSSMPYFLSTSDDMSIKLWDWDKNFECSQVFEGHAHYVMMAHWNPRDATIFATCSLDRSIKVWGISGRGTSSHFTLNGHQKGVNCVEYAPTGEKPYLISGSDDKTVKIWDYQTQKCIQTLEGHTNNVSAALFHPTLPIILTGGEDGSVRVWHSSTYRLEATLNYCLERVWSIAVLKGTTAAAIGYDEGTVVIKLGNEEPVVSMHSGKIIWAKGSEIQTANLKLADDSVGGDGEKLQLSVKDMGAAEIFPQSVAHHPNGRLFAICGDGEYVIYTAQALRNKSFGSAVEFVWSHTGNYATRDAAGKITVHQDFKESFSFKPPFAVDQLFGGRLVAARGEDFVCFYDWTEYRLVRRIDVVPKNIIWSEDGTSVVLVCADSFYILRHDVDAVQAAFATQAGIDDDGIEAAFDLQNEISDKVISGQWVGNCFVYVSQSRRLSYIIAGFQDNIAHLDRVQYLLGYMSDQSKLYLIDKELNVSSFTFYQAMIDYQAAVINGDMAASQQYFMDLPESLHNRLAHFLENQGHAAEALEISKDDDHRCELATQLGRLDLAADIIASIAKQGGALPPRGKWKSLGDVALEQGDFGLASRCFHEAKDINALFLVQTACGDAVGLEKTASLARDSGINNVAVLCYMLLGDSKGCMDVLIKAGRLPEAAFFARTYCPSELQDVVKLWKEDLAQVNKSIADNLADPKGCADLFPDFDLSLKAESAFKQARQRNPPAAAKYESEKAWANLDVMEEIKRLGPDGFLRMLMTGPGAAGEAAAPETVVEAAAAPPAVPAPAPAAAEPAPVAPEPVVAAPVSPVAAAPGPELTTAGAPPPVAPEVAAPGIDESVDLLG